MRALLVLASLANPARASSRAWLARGASPATAVPVHARVSLRRSHLLLASARVDGGSIDVDGLRKESQRKLYRAQKKWSKAAARADKCAAQQEALLGSEDPSLEALEALPNCDALRAEAAVAAERVSALEVLVDGLQEAARSARGQGEAPAELLRLATDLGVSDRPPERPKPKPRKPKGPRSAPPRLPYRVFVSMGSAEIRVGKGAGDNDKLSLEPEHRDGHDWWLHAAGCPGSHVVIRAETVGSEELPREVRLCRTLPVPRSGPEAQRPPRLARLPLVELDGWRTFLSTP